MPTPNSNATSTQSPPRTSTNDDMSTSLNKLRKSKKKRSNKGGRNRGRRNNRNPVSKPSNAFKGSTFGLEGFTYTLVNTKGGYYYQRTTKEIARFIGEKYVTIGSNLRTSILTLSTDTPNPPIRPEAKKDGDRKELPIDPMETKIYKERIRMFVKMETSITNTLKGVYNVIWGQCSDPLWSKLRGHKDFNEIETKADTLELLQLIQGQMTGFKRGQYKPHSIHLMMREFYLLSQGGKTNQEYLDEFENLVKAIEEGGGTIGMHEGIYIDAVKDIARRKDHDSDSDWSDIEEKVRNKPTPEEEEKRVAERAHTMQQELYLATAFLLGANRGIYGTLIEEIENEFFRRNDRSLSGTYPVTVTEAFEYLENYKRNPRYIAKLLGHEQPGTTGTVFLGQGQREKTDEENDKDDQEANTTIRENTLITAGRKIICKRCGEEGHTSVNCPAPFETARAFNPNIQSV